MEDLVVILVEIVTVEIVTGTVTVIDTVIPVNMIILVEIVEILAVSLAVNRCQGTAVERAEPIERANPIERVMVTDSDSKLFSRANGGKAKAKNLPSRWIRRLGIRTRQKKSEIWCQVLMSITMSLIRSIIMSIVMSIVRNIAMGIIMRLIRREKIGPDHMHSRDQVIMQAHSKTMGDHLTMQKATS